MHFPVVETHAELLAILALPRCACQCRARGCASHHPANNPAGSPAGSSVSDLVADVAVSSPAAGIEEPTRGFPVLEWHTGGQE